MKMRKFYVVLLLGIAFVGCAQTSGGKMVVNDIPSKKTFVIDESSKESKYAKDGHKYDERYDNYNYRNCRSYRCTGEYLGNGPMTDQGSREDIENRR